MKKRIFISYSHDDEKYVDGNTSHSILKFIRGLEREASVEFWHDKGKISTGDLWDDKIKKGIRNSQIAICLVSQRFIDSSYITNVEIDKFLKKRKKEGMIIYPIILSDCDWSKCEWLKQTQYIPTNHQNIERHFNNAGKRKELYTKIRKELKSILSSVEPQNHFNKPVLINNKKLIQNSDEEVTLEVADKYMDSGDYITAKNLFLGGMKFEDIPFQEQLNVLIIEQKYGLISDAQKHIEYLYNNDLANISDEQMTLLALVQLKVHSQAHNFKDVIELFPNVLQALKNTGQEVRACSVFNRTGMAYAALGDIDNSKTYLQNGFEIAHGHQENHLIITSKMYQSIAQLFCGVPCGIDNPLKQVTECQNLYFEHPINKNNVILWQTYNFKSIVQCLFCEAAIYLAKGKREIAYIRMTAANLLSPIARSHPKAEGYAELLGIINQMGIRKKVEVAMYPDEVHKDRYQKKITSISLYLKQLQKVVPILYNSPDINKWNNLRSFLTKFDEKYT